MRGNGFLPVDSTSWSRLALLLTPKVILKAGALAGEALSRIPREKDDEFLTSL
jgi:hypothetical protein